MATTTSVRLLVLDLPGAGMRDQGELLSCIQETLQAHGQDVPAESIRAQLGRPMREIIEDLWRRNGDLREEEHQQAMEDCWLDLQGRLEDLFRTTNIRPTEGALQALHFACQHGIQVAMTTSLHRRATEILLWRLGFDRWLRGAAEGDLGAWLQACVSAGATAPYHGPRSRIERAMQLLHGKETRRVAYVAATPLEIRAGREAGCRLVLGLANGCHGSGGLGSARPDRVLSSLTELPEALLQGAPYTAPGARMDSELALPA